MECGKKELSAKLHICQTSKSQQSDRLFQNNGRATAFALASVSARYGKSRLIDALGELALGLSQAEEPQQMLKSIDKS